ncbi:MAG: hypothetical protein MRJ52_12360 [Nitrosomonas sp.]|nr:hypothetical protein [Nitrosomonas sp.]
MYTIAETEIFSRYVSDYWTEEERAALPHGLLNIMTQEISFAVRVVAVKFAGHAKV